MDSKYIHSISTFLVCFFFCILNVHVHGQKMIFPVTKYGAVADGKSDNSIAFLSAWKTACGTPGGLLRIPPGTYIVRGANFIGPCKGVTYFRNEGIVRATPGAHNESYWLSFYEIDGLRIYGGGIFDGYGRSAWKLENRPTSIKIAQVTSLAIKGIKSLNSKQFHFHIVDCENVLVQNVKILAPGDSPNTDGIHVGRTTNIRILNSLISTGDDCISIGDGTEDMDIESVTCGPGHGFSIGSLGRYPNEKDVRGITVRNCNLMNTTNGLRIKTLAPSTVSSVVSNITFENINVRNVQNPIIIDQYYCPESGCSHSKESEIKIDGVKYINVKGTSASAVAVNLLCSKSVPCQNLVFEGVRITTATGESAAAICSSANYKFLDANESPRTCGQAPAVHKLL